MKFLVKINENAELDFGSSYNSARWRQFLKDHIGKWLKIELRKRTRTLPQNSWFHGVIVPMIAEEMGEDDQGEVKALLKAKFLSKEKAVAGKNNQWEKITIVGRTSKLKTVAFGEFCERCRRWAAGFLGLDIPDPDDKNAAILIDDED